MVERADAGTNYIVKERNTSRSNCDILQADCITRTMKNRIVSRSVQQIWGFFYPLSVKLVLQEKRNLGGNYLTCFFVANTNVNNVTY